MQKLSNTAVSFSLILIFVASLCSPCVAQNASGAAADAKSAPQTKQAAEAGKKVKQLYESPAKDSYKLPPAHSRDDAGNAMLSWRVHLLPFFEHENLYRRFRLNEPWDSPHNRQLIPLMPQTYKSEVDLPSGKTAYVALVSKDSVITPEGGVRFADITDGASNTILFVIANKECAVTWTSPEDIQFDPENPLRCLGELGSFEAVFCDGSVHTIPATIDKETMRRLVNRHDGLPVSLP